MAKKTGLGKILDSSIFDDDIDVFGDIGSKAIETLKIAQIEPNREQPRKVFDNEKLTALADSIIEHGIIQPLTVRELSDGVYQIVAGERRWRAAKIAGLSEVPVRIMDLSDEQTMQIALIENLQREDLNPIEEAMGYQELVDRFSMKQDEVAKKVGKARSSVTNSLRLLNLPDVVQEMVQENKLSQGHCKALMAIEGDEIRIRLAEKAFSEGLSVRALERLVKLEAEPKEEKVIVKKNTIFTEAELSLRDVIAKPVKITPGKDKITLQIECKSEDDLLELVNQLGDKLS